MRIIIEQGSTKRQLDGPFNICASREDLESLVTQLQAKLVDPVWCYGWIEVAEVTKAPGGECRNSPPEPWEHDGGRDDR